MKIRFNLEKGPNFNKWQITDIFETWYLDVGTNLLLENCKLISNKRAAQEIFDGANKRVCAWIEFETMTQIDSPYFEEVRYNPRENPFWTYKGENVDGQIFDELVVIGRKIYVCS